MVQEVLDILASLAFLEDQQGRRGREVQLARDHQGSPESLVYLEGPLGLVYLLDQLDLDHRGTQEHRVYLGGQLGLDRQGNQEYQLGQYNHLCLAYLEGLAHL